MVSTILLTLLPNFRKKYQKDKNVMIFFRFYFYVIFCLFF